MIVRISDLNYCKHVGYQNFFSFFQEARIAYLRQFNYTEMDIEGCGMIVAEANCKYKAELFFDNAIDIYCAVTTLRSKLFVMQYQILKADTVCAEGFTKNLCYDYRAKQVIRLPQPFVDAVASYERDQE
jgi:YbgC/YbaW family acyl-CoA thioester hydrolase